MRGVVCFVGCRGIRVYLFWYLLCCLTRWVELGYLAKCGVVSGKLFVTYMYFVLHIRV